MFEPRSSVNLDSWIAQFRASVDNMDSLDKLKARTKSGGCIVFAVCRGKVSEGVDFSDAYARLVVCIGIPYPAFNNPQVQQKRGYNDSLRSAAPASPGSSLTSPLDSSLLDSTSRVASSPSRPSASSRLLSGSEWYDAQAYRALNQALGRCIRHTNDWGAIILADARFVEQPSRYTSGISRWLRSR